MNLLEPLDNQPPPLVDVNLFEANRPLREAVERGGAAWAQESLLTLGAEIGSAAMIEHSRLANRNAPQFLPYDRNGHRIDEFEFHPSYHHLFTWAKRAGLDTGAWQQPRPGSHGARAALFMTFSEVEQGVCCPITMTYGAAPTVAADSGLAETWLPGLLSRDYDPRTLPATAKRGLTMGMGLTELQGGSDVRANSTEATPVANGSREHRLTGHKWFFSAPMCDAFLVTARLGDAISCFLLPRVLPDGSLNMVRIRRAKDKLGDRSNASSEVDFQGALATLIGDPGRGLPTILKMGTYTRLDCALGSAGTMRRALVEAIHHCTHRRAFGRALIEQPLMLNVLADMALEVEAATALSMRLAQAFDREDVDEKEAQIKRLLTPIAKFHVCKQAATLTQEAMECLGGNGFTEDFAMARLYRQAPLNSIWEGSGNIMCLDMLRALGRDRRAFDALESEWQPAYRNSAIRAAAEHLQRQLSDASAADEADARRLTSHLALITQAALLEQHAPEAVSAAFCASRLGSAARSPLGTLPRGSALREIVARAWQE